MKNKDLKMECPKCGSLKSNSKGKVTKTSGLYNDRRCKSCGHRFLIKIRDLKNDKKQIDNKEIMQNQEEVNIEKDYNEINTYVQTSDCIKSEEELLQKMNIDKSKWFVDSQKIKTWPVPFREGNKQLYSVACNLKKKEPDVQRVPVIQPLKIDVNFDKNVYISKSKHKIKRTIVFADMQIGYERNIQTGELTPFQDRRAIDNLLQTIYDEKPHEILTLGDNLDLTEASKYSKKPEFYFTFQPAIKELGYLMAKIRKLSPTSKIVYISGNHECVHKDTEILTSKGWKKVSEITLQDEVAQYDLETKEMSYAYPISTTSHYEKELIDFESTLHRQVVTKGHDVIFNNEKIKAKELLKQQLYQNSFPLLTKDNSLKGIDLSDDWIRLLTWVIADGCIVEEKKYNPNSKKVRIQFKLSKERKIERLQELLKKLNVKYTLKECKKGKYNKLQPYYIRIYSDFAREILRLLEGKKTFPEYFNQINSEQIKVLLDEMIVTDGTKEAAHFSYSSSKKEEIDFLQTLFISNGYITKIKSRKGNTEKGTFTNTMLYYLRIYKKAACNYKLSTKIIEYNDDVYCLEVPKGALITRYEGKTGISGNCRLERFVNEQMLWAYQLKAYNSPDEMLSIDTLLDFKSSNIHYIKEYPQGEYYINNILKGMHGEFVNLKKEMDETRVSFIMAHIHKIHKLTKTVDDRNGPLTMMGTSLGCLCRIDGKVPGVRKKPNWQNGFISVESTDNHFNLQHIYIDPYGKSIFKGKVIQGNDYKDEIKDLLYSKGSSK